MQFTKIGFSIYENQLLTRRAKYSEKNLEN